jgi:glycerate kinase
MALVINDRVKETSTSTGTGTFTLAGAQTGFDTFALGIGGSNTTYYAIVNVGASPSEWEVGLGTLDAGGTVLTRTTVITSSNSDTVVTFTSGTKRCILYIASK